MTYYPNSFDDYIGQKAAVRLLKMKAQSARNRSVPMGPTLIYSPYAGVGKTALAELVAAQLGSRLTRQTEPLKPAQVPFLFAELKPGDCLLLDEALDLETPLPTPTGWVKLHDLHEGDLLFGADGSPVRVKRLTPIKTDATCYRVTFADGTSLVTDAGHRWLAEPRSGSRYLAQRVLTTEQMFEADRSHRIPMPAPIELPEADLPLDPYALGQWLGNGNQGQYYLNVRWELIEETLDQIPGSTVLGWTSISNESIIRLNLGVPARDALVDLGIYSRKAMPSAYLRGSIKQRLALVQGLMDSDGHITEEGFCTFSNANKSVVDGMAELLRSLGYKTVVKATTDNRRGVRGPYKQVWKVTFKGVPEMPPFRLRGTDRLTPRVQANAMLIVSIRRVESRPVRCIEVDSEDHLFLAGEGFTVTHNCHKQFQGGKARAEWLLAYLERGVIPTTIGERPAPPVTLIAATTDVGALSEPFLTRFETKLELDSYNDEEAASIANILAAKILVDENGLPAPTPEACMAAARGASNNPREIVHLWETLRDLIMSGESDTGIVNGDYDMTEVLDLVGVTPDGLDSRDRRYLKLLLENRGEAVGEGFLMASLGEDRRGIRVLERRLGDDKQLIRKTKGGRVLTPDGLERSRNLAA